MLITIGAFDGFHKGHAELLEICRKNSINNDWGVVTFYPHPSLFMRKSNFKKALFTLKERKLIQKVLDIPNMLVLKFDSVMKNLTPEEFWKLINEKIKIDGLVMGSDFHFGCGRSGDSKYLEKLARSQGLDKILIVDVVNKSSYSSSNIRKKISNGEIKAANEILGYPWFMMGEIIHGNERGRTMNFPTANLKVPDEKIIPSYGVYSTAVLIGDKWYCGALSIGNNPTFHDVNETRIEVFILDFDGDIYGNEILVLFLEKVREIKTFSDKESLINQIKLDTEKCREIFLNLKNCEMIKKYVDRFTLSYKF